MKYRTKSGIVEAFKWGTHAIPDWFEQTNFNYNSNEIISDCFNEECLRGDWIIKNGKTIYPCKHEVFIQKYEPVGEE